MDKHGPVIIVEPTGRVIEKVEKQDKTMAARLPTLKGQVILVISGGSSTSPPEVLDPFCEELAERYGVARILRVAKKTTAIMTKAEIEEAAGSGARAALIGVAG
jgi:hypothetical protein